TIHLWAHVQLRAAGNASYIFDETSYGQGSGQGYGPAMIVDVQTLPTTDVPSTITAAKLQVGARPNPSMALTRMPYSVPRRDAVRLSVYDLKGARVATLIDGLATSAGEIAWDGTDSHGRRVRPGVYVVQLSAGAERVCRRLVMLGP